MIVVLFLLYMPMRLILSLLPGLPIPEFRDFVKHPEIVEKWVKWSVWVIVYGLINWALYIFIGWWSALWVSSAFAVVVLINLVVMWYRVRKIKSDAKLD